MQPASAYWLRASRRFDSAEVDYRTLAFCCCIRQVSRWMRQALLDSGDASGVGNSENPEEWDGEIQTWQLAELMG
ncbi:MAG: hypothetical protein OXN21_16640 [Chloroflexota bacterium]|nr:hypothetical protein [Chloroflexota bacterium]MDE2844984.1 hypothetical protein [Chloroflexota bacterium]